jgi:hypothetical protein
MRIFVFRSLSRHSLCAFAGDSVGSRLPEKFGPWRLIATVPRGFALPHSVPRPGIERAIVGEGFQLYRVKTKSAAG